MVNFPSSLDSLSNPTGTTLRNDPGFELHVVISTLNDIVEALEAKLGIGSTTPDAAYKILRASGAGTTSWGYTGETVIQETIVAGSDATITFSSIPANWRHLRIVLVGKTDRAANTDNVSMQFNADTASHYLSQKMTANATTQTDAEQLAAASAIVGAFAGNTGVIGMTEILIGDYARTTWNKPIRYGSFVAGTSSTGGMIADFGGAYWNQTTAITAVKLLPTNGTNFKIGTVAVLLGVPGPG